MAEPAGSHNRTSSSGSMSVNNYSTNRPAPVPAINRDMAGPSKKSPKPQLINRDMAGPSKKRPKPQLDLNNPPPPDSSIDENETASAASGIPKDQVEEGGRSSSIWTNKRKKITNWLSGTAKIFKKMKKDHRDD